MGSGDRAVRDPSRVEVDRLAEPRARRRRFIEGRRILYVDDELLVRQAVKRLLRGAGAVCITTASHEETAVLLAFEPMLDLAILDFQMPDGDVTRLLRRLNWHKPSLRVVGTSGADRRADFAERGVHLFLSKPWALDELIQVAGWSTTCTLPTEPSAT